VETLAPAALVASGRHRRIQDRERASDRSFSAKVAYAQQVGICG
jgi:hypothetical protein